MPKLSIIIPVYNVEEYLSRCIDSILRQEFTDFEAILVDDGSPDRCGELIDEYTQKDKRIKAIHQRNKGVSSARNAGLKIAKGEYISFVDPDDWVDKKMYRLLVKKMEDFSADIVCCGWTDVIDDEYKIHKATEKERVENKERFAEHIFDMPRTIVGSTCILNKLFKRDRISHEFDETIHIYEDAKFLLQYCTCIDLGVTITDCLCFKFQRKDSLSHSNQSKNALYLYIRKEMIGIARSINSVCRDKAEAEYLDACIWYLKLLEKEENCEMIELLKRRTISYFKKNFMTILNNKYIGWKLMICYAKYLIS